MPKRKVSKGDTSQELTYLLRLTYFKPLKGEHRDKSKVRRFKPSRSSKSETAKNVYTRSANQGDKLTNTHYAYFKDKDKAEEFAAKIFKRFKESKFQKISGSMQIIQGKVKRGGKYVGAVGPGTLVSRNVPIYQLDRRKSLTSFENEVTDALEVIDEIEEAEARYDPHEEARKSLAVRRKLDAILGPRGKFERKGNAKKSHGYAKAKGRA